MRNANRKLNTLLPAGYAAVAAVSLALQLAAQRGRAGLLPVLWVFFLSGALILLQLLRGRLRLGRIGWPCLAGAALMAVSTFFSFLLRSHALAGRPLAKAGAALLVFAAYALLFEALAGLDKSLFAGPQPPGEHLRPSRLLLLGAVFLLVLLLEYRLYFPYGRSGDTINQWRQIHGLVPYNTVHAIGHTIFLKGLLRLWDSYTVVVWFQMLAVTAFCLWAADFFYARGLSLPFVAFALTMGLIWTNAATDAYFYPWKDTPAALCLGVTTLLMARLTEERPLRLWEALLLGTALAWCCLFRLNGLVALLICGVCCLALLWKRRCPRQLAAMLLAAAVSLGGVGLYSSLVLRPEKMDNGFALQIFGASIAAAVHEDAMTEAELAEIEQVLPVDWMREKYGDPRNKRALLWDDSGSERIAAQPSMEILNNDFVIRMGENKAAVIRLFFRLLPGHFPTMARDLLGSMAIVWMQDSLFFPACHLFWAAALGSLALRRRLRLPDWLPFLPCVCNTLSIMISTATDEIRYLLPTFLMAPVFLLYLARKTEP